MPVKHECPQCLKIFFTKPYRLKSEHFCSKKCHNEKMRRGANVICKICGDKFYVRNSKIGSRLYCSRECDSIAKTKSILRQCKTCDSEFYSTPSQVKLGKGKYCSRKCTPLYRPNDGTKFGKDEPCFICNKMVYRPPYLIGVKKFCSRECMTEAAKRKVFKLNKNFKNGRSFFYRQTLENRDKPCTLCEGMGRNRQLHHIDGNPFNNDLSNLIRLCGSCHTRIHVLNRQGLFTLKEALEHCKLFKLWKFHVAAFREHWKRLKHHCSL